MRQTFIVLMVKFGTDIVTRKPETSNCLESWSLCVTLDTRLVITTIASPELESPSSTE